MGKGKPRSVEKGELGQNSTVISPGSLKIPPGPVYYPTEEEFKDPLEFISKIRSEAEKYGICKIVPPKSWKPPFSLDLDSFTFRTKSQAIHQLQVRPASCDSKTFELEYVRFLEENGVRKAKKRVVFEGEELDLCRLFNAVKRFGGYDRVVKDKKWGEVFRIVRPVRKDSECAKHVLCQLYREHLYDYEIYISRLNRESDKSKIGKRMHDEGKCDQQFNSSSSKRRGKNHKGETVEVDKAEEEFDQICEQCRSGLHGEVMLLCDRCNKGWHIYCLSPPLKRIPHGNWYCSECLNSEKDCFGFVTGRRISLDSFRRVADRAKRKWFGSVSTSRVQLEKKFWEIVEGSVGEVEVKYGSDLDTSVYGSGFPRVSDPRPQSIGADLWDKYCASPWNLNNLPKLQGSMLQAVHNSIAGVMVPWLYIGMLFSSFCWHFEDHCFYSMNYLHWGEPKCWYSVPGSEACAFEKVMRNTLPDLFDVQPDLLFQLVTMLNPSVLQDSNVPVYSVLQEPGNFVITFPRSYHGGFNFGLNCAEAVNFAPADWLPHGGFGAGLYQLYRKAAVLSHEELLCVVAKTDLDSKVTPYLKNELLRIYDKEKTWRERLWRNGIVDSSSMSPREQPTYLGIQEDPTCIICQQFLYLSAIGCRCRPSAFVCLEHWEHLCECKANKHRLLYRHTLVELNDMILNVERRTSDETLLNRNSRRQLPCSQDSGALSKKIKGGLVTLVQLAEEWLLKSCRILHKPYSSDAFANVLKEAEQFLWAGSEMDPVRDMTRNLIEAKNWADSVRDCVSKLELWSNDRSHGMERVQMERVRNLLSFDPVPCNEPGHLTLKVYRQEAEVLIQEINSALSTCMEVSIADWEILYVKACDSGILVEESDKLLHKLSSVKIWKDSVRKCISEKSPSTVEVDTLEKLKSEVSELQVQLPEIEMLWDLIKQVESCQSRCSEMLKGSISLKKLELFLREMAGFTVNIPELKLLKQYQNDAMSWISRFKNCVNNAQESDDQENVVDELICLLKDGALLKIEVDELSQVEVELKKACCREKAQKALGCKMSLDSIQQLLVEATILQIEKEKLFADISGIQTAALSWEERAKHILLSEAQMSDFEDLIRTSQDICLILPSLDDVNEAVLAARIWLNKSKPFLSSDLSVPPTSKSLLNFGALKELVSQTNLLKISLGESQMLRTVLDNCIQCELDACSLLNDMESLLNKVNDFGDESCKILVEKVQSQVASFEDVVTSGPCLYFDFVVTPKLQDACSTLRCCLKALSFRDDAPTIEEVEMLLEVAGHLPGTYASCELWNSLVVGVNWLKKALEILLPCNRRRFKLSDAEEALHKSQAINVSFPVMVGQLANAIKQHKLWVEQVQRFLTVKSADRSYLLLLWLKELGSTDAFNCSELDLVLFEVERVEQWRRSIEDIAGSVGNAKALLCALSEMTNSLDRSLQICDKFTGCKPSSSCLCCSSEIKDQEELLTCSICIHCYHISCMVATCPTLGDSNDDSTKRICPCCEFIKSGKIIPSGKQQCPIELNKLIEVSSEAQILPVWIEERDMLCQIIERSHSYKACLTQVVDSVLVHLDEDLNIVTQKLSNAFKAVEVAGVYDHDVNGKFGLALARNSWRVRARKLVQGSKKPTIQQIQLHLKEGSAISMPSGDHFRQKLEEVKHNGIQWADKAKKVSVDSGALELHKVFELITEGKGLLVDVQKELKLLEERSMLYCICRKPNDRRAMIACDKCDEWYHFVCVKLTSAPKIYICPACKLGVEEDLSAFSSPMMTQERSTGSKCEAPQTPSPRGTESTRRRRRRPEEQDKSSGRRKRNKVEETRGGIENNSGVGGTLLWRNRKPFRRVVRKRQDLNVLSPLSSSSYVKLRQL